MPAKSIGPPAALAAALVACVTRIAYHELIRSHISEKMRIMVMLRFSGFGRRSH